MPWLGPLPEAWAAVPLKQRTSLVSRGRSPDYSEDEQGVPIINQACIYWDGVHFGNVKWQRRSTLSGERGRLRQGDLLMNSTGTGTLGRVAMLDSAGEYLADSHVTVIRTTLDASPSFLRYVLQTDIYQGYVYAVLAPGATNQIELSREGLRRTPFPMPPVEEQRAIAVFLDRKTAAIDALITQAVTKGLDPNVPMKDSGVEWFGSIPRHWDLVELRRLTKPGTSITYGIVQAGPHVEGGVPYIRTGDMAGDVLPLSGYQSTSGEIDESYRRSRVEAGDIVVAIRATVGKALPVPAALTGANLTQGTAKVSPGDAILSDFLLWALRCPGAQQRFAALAKGATFREITLDMLRRFPVPVPPIDEQHVIVRKFALNETRIAAALGILATSVAGLHEYRQALITAAVTGKLDVERAGAQPEDRVEQEAMGA